MEIHAFITQLCVVVVFLSFFLAVSEENERHHWTVSLKTHSKPWERVNNAEREVNISDLLEFEII